MLGERIKRFLDENHVTYEFISHPREFSSTRTCQAAHVHGNEFAKTVILKMDGRLVMCVVTANQMVFPGYMKNFFNAKNIEIASESDFKNAFPDCEVGAMPPFGNLYGVDEFISMDLTRDEYIAFNAGSHTELIRMKFSDFEKLVHPRIVNLHYNWR
ncbi:MAG TPA: YbaK/EbsC family protein [Spirochaetota bacterium]|nr:YbaK/EbsC family protein [Spirochaetota bacterium]HRZ27914.1 YbaK/EbsC family protein [Spirochaetota bacterium]HSA15277.1 YbaK/EbsC family protein [Spirochaetota bacterium]